MNYIVELYTSNKEVVHTKTWLDLTEDPEHLEFCLQVTLNFLAYVREHLGAKRG
jgi:hypothetical protein